jgi:protein TonB
MRRSFLLLSLALHLSFILFTWWLATQWTNPSEPTVEFLEVEWHTATADPLSENREQQKAERPQASAQAVLPKQQVVEQEEKSLNNETPEESRFLSATNQVVKKQTKAMEVGEFKNRSQTGWKNFQPQSQWLQQAGAEAKELAEGKVPAPDSDELAITALPRRDSAKRKLATQPQSQGRGQAAQGKGEDTANMLPQGEGDGVSATMDYLPDIDPGLETLLSTREFIYHTFYKRMRQQLSQYWTPQVRSALQRIYSSGRRIASSHALVTRCLITLNAKGDLVKVTILGASGFHELDKAAFQALKEAAPFRNPPQGMVDEDGLIRIRWDFVIDS